MTPDRARLRELAERADRLGLSPRVPSDVLRALLDDLRDARERAERAEADRDVLADVVRRALPILESLGSLWEETDSVTIAKALLAPDETGEADG